MLLFGRGAPSRTLCRLTEPPEKTAAAKIGRPTLLFEVSEVESGSQLGHAFIFAPSALQVTPPKDGR
jgi:hypothetical protein